MSHCEPANTIIALLGGIRPTAIAAETTETTVRRWRLPIESGGTGGFIPRKKHAALLALARQIGVDLPPLAFLDVSALPERAASEAAA
jgi:hypothetical protein